MPILLITSAYVREDLAGYKRKEIRQRLLKVWPQSALSPNSSREIHRLLLFLAKRRPMPAISSWRGKAGIDPTVVARALWLETHPQPTGQADLPVNAEEANRKTKTVEEEVGHGVT
jgi:hypothetical protein